VDVRLFLVVGLELVLWRARGDIIEIHGTAVPEIVNVVDAAAGAFLDRAARAMFLLRALLGATEAAGRRGRTEVGRPIADAAARARLEASAPWPRPPEASSGWATTSGPWSPEPATRRPEAAGARRTWSGETALARRAGRTIFAGARLAHRQITTHEGLRIEALDDFIGDAAFGELHEREASRPTGFPIDRHRHMGRLGNWREVCAEIRFRCAVRQVADEQTDWHVYPRVGRRFGGLRF
jgi:hypothetical protein